MALVLTSRKCLGAAAVDRRAPFANLSNDPDQQYLADGITEDLTIDLSRIGHMFVIAHSTAAAYRDKAIGTSEIGRELGVRYILEGSVQRASDRIRINAQLTEAETSAHLWAERFDRKTSDLFDVQNEITRLIASTLNLELIRAEKIRRTDHPDALDYILRGRAVWLLNTPTRDSFAEAISLFEHALALAPKSAEAQTDLAGALANRVLSALSAWAAADLARAVGLIDQALPASRRSEYAHFVKGEMLRAQHRSEDAVPEYEMVLAINRNFPLALHGLALCKLYIGSIEEVIPLEEEAIRLGPRDPGIAYRYGVIGTVHLVQSRTDEAIVWLEKARSTMSSVPFNHIRLASAYALRVNPNRPGTLRQSRHGANRAATILYRCGLAAASAREPTGGYHAQALRSLDPRDDDRRNSGQSGDFCAGVAIWMVATRSGRPVALGRRLGPPWPLGAPRPKLGLPFAPPAVARRTVGERPRRALGMARRLGSRWRLGAPRSELGLPLAVADRGWRYRPNSRL